MKLVWLFTYSAGRASPCATTFLWNSAGCWITWCWNMFPVWKLMMKKLVSFYCSTFILPLSRLSTKRVLYSISPEDWENRRNELFIFALDRKSHWLSYRLRSEHSSTWWKAATPESSEIQMRLFIDFVLGWEIFINDETRLISEVSHHFKKLLARDCSPKYVCFYCLLLSPKLAQSKILFFTPSSLQWRGFESRSLTSWWQKKIWITKQRLCHQLLCGTLLSD